MKNFEKKVIYLSVFLSFFLSSHVVAQNNADSITYYLGKDLKPCPVDQMYYVGFGKKENNLFRLNVYTTGVVKLAITGYYTDSTLAKREGEFHDYDETGHVISTLHFHQDTAYGYYVSLNKDYLCQDSILYENGKDVMSITYNYANQKKYSRVVNDVRDGSKEYTKFFEDGSIQAYGYWKNGTGDQTEYYKYPAKRKAITRYEKNKVTVEWHFNEDGTVIPEDVYKKQQDMANSIPSYPGGLNKLAKDIAEKVRSAFRNESFGANINGLEYRLSFMVNKKGRGYDLKVNGLPESAPLYRAFKDALESSEKFDMKGQELWGPVYITIRLY